MDRMRLLRCLSMVSALFFGNASLAKELRWTHFGSRPLGMGNAFVAVSDDYNALFYNPAGLARIKEWDGEFLNPSMQTAASTIDFMSEISDLEDGALEQTADVLDLFQAQTGKIHHMSLSLSPHLVFKNFGLAIGTELPFSMVTHNNINIEFEAGVRIIAPFGFAMNFLEDRLSLGASVKLLARGGVDQAFTIQNISSFSSPDALGELVEGGAGAGFDLGLLFTPVKPMEPTIGISLTDFGGSTYSRFDVGQTATRTPESRLPSLNTGFSIKPIQTSRMYLLAAVDAHMLNQPIHYSHKLNFGLEWGYSSIVKLQTGLKEGYMTAGVQFDVGLMNLRFVTYAIDHGPVVGTHDDLMERRFALQLKLFI